MWKYPEKNVKIMTNRCFHFAINLERSTILSHYYFFYSHMWFIDIRVLTLNYMFVVDYATIVKICCWLRNYHIDWEALCCWLHDYRIDWQELCCRLRDYRIEWQELCCRLRDYRIYWQELCCRLRDNFIECWHSMRP